MPPMSMAAYQIYDHLKMRWGVGLQGTALLEVWGWRRRWEEVWKWRGGRKGG